MIVNRILRRAPLSSPAFVRLAAFGLISVISTTAAHSQTGVPNTPAEAGDGVQSYDARQLELMRVREAAQRARASAQRAAMARSAERAIEEQHLQENVQRSLEMKKIKAQAAEDVRNQTSTNAYKGVSSAEISDWQGRDNGPVTVRKDVPREFVDSIPDLEENEEGSGGIGGMMKGVFSWRPFGRRKDDSHETNPQMPTFAPAESLGLEAAPPVVQEPRPSTGSKSEKSKKKSGLFGGLFGGKKEKEEEPFVMPAVPGVAPAPAPAPTALPEPVYAEAPAEEEKKGFFSRLNPFSKSDKTSAESAAYDAPVYANTESAVALPQPTRSSDDQAASAGLFGPVGAPQQGMIVAAEAEEKKPGFFGRLFGGGDKSEKVAASRRSGSGVNTGGGIYVVKSQDAQLLKFGNSTVSSEAMPMPAGTVIRVTKPGEEWSSVQLPSGAEGIIRNKSIRPAETSEGSPSMFAHLDKQRYTTTARIGARSAGGNSGYQPPVSVPTPQLPSAGSAIGQSPAGNGLLPPLPASAVE